MPRARSEMVSLETTSYYHVISRCVRQSFLCGKNNESGISYEHRRSWIERRLLFLSSVFAIDLCAYSIMHNHYHITVHLNVKQALNLSDREVVERWHKIYKGTPLSQRFIVEGHLTHLETQELKSTCNIWRARLYDISWFMRCSNEPIARRANKEDGCTGHFWDGRFKSIAILDYRALLATMVYNELNPIKAGIASDIESLKFTSIHKRLKQRSSNANVAPGMAAFADDKCITDSHVLPFQFSEYQEAIVWTARKYKVFTSQPLTNPYPTLLDSIGLIKEQWAEAVINFESNFTSIIGTHNNIKQVCQRLNRQWMHGIINCQRCFDSSAQENNPLMSKMLAAPPNIQT